METDNEINRGKCNVEKWIEIVFIIYFRSLDQAAPKLVPYVLFSS